MTKLTVSQVPLPPMLLNPEHMLARVDLADPVAPLSFETRQGHRRQVLFEGSRIGDLSFSFSPDENTFRVIFNAADYVPERVHEALVTRLRPVANQAYALITDRIGREQDALERMAAQVGPIDHNRVRGDFNGPARCLHALLFPGVLEAVAGPEFKFAKERSTHNGVVVRANFVLDDVEIPAFYLEGLNRDVSVLGTGNRARARLGYVSDLLHRALAVCEERALGCAESARALHAEVSNQFNAPETCITLINHDVYEPLLHVLNGRSEIPAHGIQVRHAFPDVVDWKLTIEKTDLHDLRHRELGNGFTLVLGRDRVDPPSADVQMIYYGQDLIYHERKGFLPGIEPAHQAALRLAALNVRADLDPRVAVCLPWREADRERTQTEVIHDRLLRAFGAAEHNEPEM